MNAACGWTLIRKTSLLRKINPMMRRSSFTKKIIYNLRILQVLPNKKHERRNDLEIVNWIPQIALQIQNSDRSPLYDVRNPARARPRRDATCEVMFRGRYIRGNLLNAKASIFNSIWWSQTGSNRRPHACKARALPAELWPRNQKTNASQ